MKSFMFASLVSLAVSAPGFAKDQRSDAQKEQDIRDVAAQVKADVMNAEQKAELGEVVLSQSACQNPIGSSSRNLRCILRFEAKADPYTFVVAAYFGEPGDVWIEETFNQYQESDYVAPALAESSAEQQASDIKDIAKAIYKQTMTKEQRKALGKVADLATSECEQPVGLSSRNARCLINFASEAGSHAFVVEAYFGEPGDIWISDVITQYDEAK